MFKSLAEWRAKNVVGVADGDQARPGNQQLEALNQRSFSWLHVKVIIVAGLGFLCDSYDLFNISYVTNTIGRIYYPDTTYYSPSYCLELGLAGDCGSNYDKYTSHGYNFTAEQAAAQVPSAMPSDINYVIKAVALVGTFCGQIAFGYLGDRYGRRPMFGLSLAIMIFGALAQGLSFGSTPAGVIATLCVWRFILGIGIGGDYPLSATYMSEYASKSNRGALVGAVFAMQGVGIFLAAIVTMIVSACFLGAPGSADYLWRTVLMLGAVPTALGMFFRLNLPETPRYTLYAKKNARLMQMEMESIDNNSSRAALAAASITDVVPKAKIDYAAILRKHGWQLAGTMVCWFLLDVAYYSQNLFQPVIYTTIGWLPPAFTMDPITEAFMTARANLIIALCSVIPGYWFTVAFVDKIGRIPIQITGFAVMTLCMLILTAAYHELVTPEYMPAFVVIYAIAFFFANFGPNSTTFIIPSEVFPTVFRSTGHGISAGAGKLGSIVGTFGFGFATSSIGLQASLAILTATNFIGLLFTFLIPETLGKSLEEMSGDTEDLPSPNIVLSANTSVDESDDKTEAKNMVA